MGLLPPTSARGDFGTLLGFIDSGINHCRAGRWDKGVEYLRYVAEREPRGLGDAGLFLSYLGCAVARTQGRAAEGLALCEQAVKVEFYQPENWANLAEVLILCGRRGEAMNAIEQGMDIDSRFGRLQVIHRRLGERRPPVVRFLPRSNPLNHLLGMVRYQIAKPAYL
jgi:tetratricopeptide (TPR) repeat protein